MVNDEVFEEGDERSEQIHLRGGGKSVADPAPQR